MKFKKYRVCVIDDEADIRKILKQTLNESLEFEVVGEAESVESGIEVISKMKPHAVFLDIKLRGGDAFQLMSYLKNRMEIMPAIILNTGYNDFEFAQKAINLYRDEVIMILQKPFWEDWNEKESEIASKVKDYHHSDDVFVSPARISIKSNHTTWLIQLEDLIFIEVPIEHKGRGKILLQTTYKSFLINNSLNNLESELPSSFLRINRYTIINTKFVSHFDHSQQAIFMRNVQDRFFSVGDKYKKLVLDSLEN